MAITLDELLGRGRGESPQDAAVDRFPSYGEFTARRTARDDAASPAPGGYGQGHDRARRVRAAMPPRAAEGAREYEASRPYRAPREEEYRADYSVRERSLPSDAGYDRERGRAGESGLYEFTRNDAERASGEELYERLSSTGSVQNSARYEQAARASYLSEDYAAKYRAENGGKKKRRFGLKAKLLIAAYVIVLAVVGVLIIVNAVPLNEGTAAVPASGIVSVL